MLGADLGRFRPRGAAAFASYSAAPAGFDNGTQAEFRGEARFDNVDNVFGA